MLIIEYVLIWVEFGNDAEHQMFVKVFMMGYFFESSDNFSSRHYDAAIVFDEYDFVSDVVVYEEV